MTVLHLVSFVDTMHYTLGVKVDIVLAAKLYNNYLVVAVLCFYCFSSKECDAVFSVISWLICHGLLPQTW